MPKARIVMPLPCPARPTSTGPRPKRSSPRSKWPAWLPVVAAAVLTGISFIATPAVAGDADWPQWRGPHRDGHAAPQDVMSQWPEDGPPRKWEFQQAGRGYSSVAVVDDQLFTMGSRAGACFALCVDAKTGETLWETEISRASTDDDYLHGWGGGPRSTPTVDGDQVFVLSDIGVVAALDRSGGDLIWKVDLVEDHGGSIPKWGYSESVLVDDKRIVVTPGGDPFLIAVDRDSGEKVWESSGIDEGAQYVSIIKGTMAGTDFYVTASASGIVAFDADSGELLFRDESTGNRTAVIPTPVLAGDLLYHTSNYGAGNTLLRLKAPDGGGIDAESVYHFDGKTMTNHHGGVVLVDETIYGFSKTDGGTWMAQDLESGEVLWSERVGRNSSGSIAYADGRLYCYNDKDGTVILAEPNREAWSPKGTLTLPKETQLSRDKGAIWAHPVVAGQTLYIRDQDLLFAFDLTE